MTHLSSNNAALIELFLQTQGFRHPATHKNYAGILRNFVGFLTDHRAVTSPDIAIVTQWLKQQSLKWQVHILYHQAASNLKCNTCFV
ncbi:MULTISPECIES: hypothetical protein [Caballeronia]|uniref:hypothetical protein n=1 Tax=Caballeronia TaxID=1827195 RepID=UPI00045EE3F0|nr:MULTISPECIES: hypothetical protein [unclassified Caballeronia]MCE4547491.1 hypothetical protein [Caballeronia sp. PC1]MCE4575476.1 hypothetical protein [Caballeronia sp. CLC5]BAO92586.1 putative membrane protein [Burkholderia sp. RPE67]